MKTEKIPNPRFFVPDLSPEQRKELKDVEPRFIFVAESPHINEIEPDQQERRRPLCGAAGRQWWGMLSSLLEGAPNSDVSLEHLIQTCKKYKISVMNAVQYPLDPKINKRFPDADPEKNLGFNKVSGAFSFKKLKSSPVVLKAIESLQKRLTNPKVAQALIFCLGNDAEWFVIQALGKDQAAKRMGEKIPHPSAWWRKNGLYGKIAREKLEKILTER